MGFKDFKLVIQLGAKNLDIFLASSSNVRIFDSKSNGSCRKLSANLRKMSGFWHLAVFAISLIRKGKL